MSDPAFEFRDRGSQRVYYFTRSVESEDWDCFALYAQRVRVLLFTDTIFVKQSDGSVQLFTMTADGLFDEMAYTRTTLKLLPNLQKLEWCPYRRMCIPHALLFMHQGVKTFVAHLYPISAGTGSESDQRAYASLIKNIVARMPELTLLDLRFSFSVDKTKREIMTLFAGLPNLRKVVLPQYCITSDMLEVLSRLQTLGSIQFQPREVGNLNFAQEQEEGERKDVLCIAPTLSSGAFPALWDLSLSARLSDLTQLLNAPYAPTNITNMYAHVISLDTPEIFTAFLSTVGKNCRSLKSLAIYIDLSLLDTGLPTTRRPLTLNDLRPLMAD